MIERYIHAACLIHGTPSPHQRRSTLSVCYLANLLNLTNISFRKNHGPIGSHGNLSLPVLPLRVFIIMLSTKLQDWRIILGGYLVSWAYWMLANPNVVSLKPNDHIQWQMVQQDGSSGVLPDGLQGLPRLGTAAGAIHSSRARMSLSSWSTVW